MFYLHMKFEILIKYPYEKKSSNFCAIFVQLHTETVQFLQFLGQKPPYDFCKKTKT